jgi:predicted Fe-Mo cluster-binding NifX family protein
MGFNQVGIEVYHGGNAATVGEAMEALLAGRLPRFTQEQTCGGGGGH